MAGWAPRSSGAQEQKDWNYEFGVTLGAARGNITRTGDVDKDLALLLEEVVFMLKAKTDPRMVAAFNKFWPIRPKLGNTVTSNPNIKILK